MREIHRALVVSLLAIVIVFAGCTRSQNPVGGNAGMQSVNMSAAFSKSGVSSLGKTDGMFSTDSLQIDSAIVIFHRIKFESHIDSVMVDSTENVTGHDSDDDGREVNLVFKGPFVVHVRDTMTVNFANQELPAGVYDGIKFKIHRIGSGERYEDSDQFNHHPMSTPDTSFLGSSIVVWGKVKKSGAWVPFAFRYNGELEFKIKGNFVVESATSSVNVVLRFDIGSWFRDRSSGALLDPTDASSHNRELISWAIRHSFKSGKGGHDHNRDGLPDND